jgi:hypothetical protein
VCYVADTAVRARDVGPIRPIYLAPEGTDPRPEGARTMYGGSPVEGRIEGALRLRAFDLESGRALFETTLEDPYDGGHLDLLGLDGAVVALARGQTLYRV